MDRLDGRPSSRALSAALRRRPTRGASPTSLPTRAGSSSPPTRRPSARRSIACRPLQGYRWIAINPGDLFPASPKTIGTKVGIMDRTGGSSRTRTCRASDDRPHDGRL